MLVIHLVLIYDEYTSFFYTEIPNYQLYQKYTKKHRVI